MGPNVGSTEAKLRNGIAPSIGPYSLLPSLSVERMRRMLTMDHYVLCIGLSEVRG